MKVGLTLPQAAGSEGAGGTWREIREVARVAEDGGADSVWLYDHFLDRRADGTQTGYHEPWTLVSALAEATQRVEIGTLVLAMSFRPPGLLAKMAATADLVAGGRLILGLGCGWYEPEYRAFGYPYDHRVGRFEEGLEIVTRLLRGGSVTFAGRWNTIDEAILLPPPAHRTPILVAATRPRMLRLTARFADAWQSAWFGRPDKDYLTEYDNLLAACDTEDRDPATLEVTVGVEVGKADPGDPHLELEPSAIADGLAAWAELGVGHIMLGVHPATPATFGTALEGIRRFREG
jgi:alkanesulfonate monooxygenase SsuD/methylene tetrahydromethanopterin reductase-like flavin-dependent oxidoreductase (luciferase family)